MGVGRLGLAVLGFIACAGRTGPPASARGPEAANERVLIFEGPLVVDAMPQHAIEVRGRDIYVWAFVEGSCADGREVVFSAAEAAAKADLRQFVDVAVQQLDLHFQAVGQPSASSEEAQKITQQVLDNISAKLGKSQRAYQKLEREGQMIERVFVRYSVSKNAFEDAFIAGIGERPLKADVVHRVIASFDPDDDGAPRAKKK